LGREEVLEHREGTDGEGLREVPENYLAFLRVSDDIAASMPSLGKYAPVHGSRQTSSGHDTSNTEPIFITCVVTAIVYTHSAYKTFTACI
jgi:hypothetical protein